MICITPPADRETLTTEDITSVIAAHAADTALLLLPGIQYYTGQLFDIRAITAFARQLGIFVIWDLAHAVGNVPLSLHDWDVDAAAWCTYKYVNAGPGSIGGLFVHERHTRTSDGAPDAGYDGHLAGWWGNRKATRFIMATSFEAAPGAAAFQISNPSVIDITSLTASLEIFALAGGVSALREKSLRLTGYLEELLQTDIPSDLAALFRVITPSDPERRGAQLSLRLADGLLHTVMAELERRAVITDERNKKFCLRVCTMLLEKFEKKLFNQRKYFGMKTPEIHGCGCVGT